MTAPASDPGPAERDQDLEDLPVGELVQRAAQQVSQLVRQELALAQQELREKGKRAGLGVGLLGGAGLVALYGLAVLVAAVVLLIATQLEPWVAALIVAGGLFAGAGVLALIGRNQAEQAIPPVPEQAAESIREDVAYIKERSER